CHRYGARLFLAVNTLIADSEAEELCGYIKFCAGIGVDGYIVQDWGCAELIRRCVPDAVLHASTQMSVHTAAGAELLRELGWARVVPARELSRDVLARICSLGIETEVFVHGALCMSVSGQCYMSAVIGSRSANRGRCGQACRLPFSAVGDKNAAALSLKDLSLIPRVDELRSIGVDSLKIEGRMKRPEYVASAVNELKCALGGGQPDMQTLRGIFSRSGFTDGYFTGKMRDMFGVREKEDVTAAQSLIPKIHELYRFERKAARADFHAVIREGEPVVLTAVSGDASASVTGNVPEMALNRPTDIAQLERQLTKLGDTIFTAGNITADIGEGLMVPAGELNRLRREVTERLTELLIAANTPHFTVTDYSPTLPLCSRQVPDVLPVRALCRTLEQARAAAELSEYIIVPADLDIQVLTGVCRADRIIVSPPRFITDEDRLAARLTELKNAGISRLFCHTPDCIALGRRLGMRLHGSFTLNAFNSYSAEFLRSLGLEDCVFSFEATSAQMSSVRTSLPLGAAVYGRLPLMLTRNCPIRNEVGCARCTGHLIDRTGRVLPVACSKEYVEVLNSDLLFVPDARREFPGAAFGLVLLHDEDAEQTRAALTGVKPQGAITRGLYRRGVLEV
ncbi:MAG: U32 family peptidase, partial [Ruminococcus sp.]|nr:U32 family peptidase [Ruminococcus sp.]